MAPEYDIILRLFFAVVLAAVLGWEREMHRKPAGLRTHMMVSLGGASPPSPRLRRASVARPDEASAKSGGGDRISNPQSMSVETPTTSGTAPCGRGSDQHV